MFRWNGLLYADCANPYWGDTTNSVVHAYRVNQDEDFQDLRGPWVNQELLASQGRKETPELKVFLALKGELVPLVLLELKVMYQDDSKGEVNPIFVN